MNKWLKGNGYWCLDCGGSGRGRPLDRITYGDGSYCQFYAVCQACNGEKRLSATEQQIIDGTAPQTPQPATHSCFLPIIEYGKLTPSGRMPRSKGD